MRQAIVIGSTTTNKDWLQNCLNSFGKYDKYPIIVVVNDDFELGKIKWVYENTTLDEFFLLHDTVEIKDTRLFDEAFGMKGKSYALSDHPAMMGMFLGKYRRKVLDNLTLPESKTKKEAVIQEVDFNKLYATHELNMILCDQPLRNTNVFEFKFGRKNMVLENDYIKKYKGTWCWEQVS